MILFSSKCNYFDGTFKKTRKKLKGNKDVS